MEAFARRRSITASVASDDTIVWPGRGSFDSRGSFSVSFASGSASSASLDVWVSSMNLDPRMPKSAFAFRLYSL